MFSKQCFKRVVVNGCTNLMTCDKDLFKDLSPTKVTKVKIGHGGYIPAKGMGTITIETQSGTKTISNVLYVPDLDQNLLSVGQLLEKDFKLYFEDKHCLIKEASGQDLFKVKMRGISFSLNPLEEERGFHQSRVELPLLKEDIPPDDEGWLCTGCDCKDAAATSGEKLDDISGLPSDDSENGLPDIPCPNEVSAKHLGEEISSPENDLVLLRNNSGLARGGGLCSLNGFQNMTHLEYDSECKLYLESNISVQRKEMPEAANAEKLSELELENACDEKNATQSDELPLPSNSQLAQVESCQILGNNSVGDSALTQFRDPCCRTSAALQEIQKTIGSSSTEEKLKVGGMSTSESRLSGKRKAYGEVTTKKLCESFKENNYPNCDAKEKFEQSGGWIKALPEEAENERMHLMTMSCWSLEVEAINSYTLYLNDIDRGEIENVPAPAIAIDYWRLPKDVTLKDVDEAYHRDVNHFASPWETYQTDLSIDLNKHHVPKKFLDKVAYWSVKLLRIPTDLFFKERYGCHAMMLETVAGIPRMVGGMLLHMRSLLKFELLRKEFVDFYMSLMGTAATLLPAVSKDVMQLGPKLSQQQKIQLCCPITNRETQAGFIAIRIDKSPDIDGFNATFFKHA
ncbi:Ubiquinol oxidase 2, mitochondrial [Capsicum annuum]|nr:Ubiquinol oxidase 2, mitochondrial [Capsicum annuum]KAF3669991.1 Ubiquinol oxidase 2, mitochondrial [Capsicum annuum]